MAIAQGGRYNLELYQRASFSQAFEYREPDEATAIPLTGYVARAQIWDRAGGTKLADLDATVDGPAGTVTVSASPAVTGTLKGGGVWALEIDNGTNIYVLVSGHVRIHAEITTP